MEDHLPSKTAIHPRELERSMSEEQGLRSCWVMKVHLQSSWITLANFSTSPLGGEVGFTLGDEFGQMRLEKGFCAFSGHAIPWLVWGSGLLPPAGWLARERLRWIETTLPTSDVHVTWRTKEHGLLSATGIWGRFHHSMPELVLTHKMVWHL